MTKVTAPFSPEQVDASLSSRNARNLIARLENAVVEDATWNTASTALTRLHARRKLELFAFDCLVSEYDPTTAVVELKMALHKAKTENARLRRQLKAKTDG